MPPRLPLLALALAVLALPASAELLPETFVRLMAARLEPAERDFEWAGWIGAGASLLRSGRTTAYFTADVESVLGSERRPFEANQVNYHLEGGVRRSFGGWDGTIVLHHVSRHAIDRSKPAAVDWNVVGLRVSRRFERGRITLGAGHTTLRSFVDYRWEITARADGDLLRRPWGAVYGTAAARGVTTDVADSPFARDGFVDVQLETGVRFRRESRTLSLFGGFERRHDVFLEEAGSRNRGLFGFRIGLGD